MLIVQYKSHPVYLKYWQLVSLSLTVLQLKSWSALNRFDVLGWLAHDTNWPSMRNIQPWINSSEDEIV